LLIPTIERNKKESGITEKKYIGFDCHKKYVQVMLVNKKEKMKQKVRLRIVKKEIQRYIRRIKGEKEAVFEAARS